MLSMRVNVAPASMSSPCSKVRAELPKQILDAKQMHKCAPLVVDANVKANEASGFKVAWQVLVSLACPDMCYALPQLQPRLARGASSSVHLRWV